MQSSSLTCSARRQPLPELHLRQPEQGYRFAEDALNLADFAVRFQARTILDLGAGCGVVGWLLAAAQRSSRVVALELQAALARYAEENRRANGLEARTLLVRGDLRSCPRLIRPGSFDLVVCNPPFGRLGHGRLSPDPGRSAASHELHCTLEDVIRAAMHALQPRGRLALIHRPERLGEVFRLAGAHTASVEMLRFVHPTSQTPARRVLVAVRRDWRGSPTVLPPLIQPRGARGRGLPAPTGKPPGTIPEREPPSRPAADEVRR